MKVRRAHTWSLLRRTVSVVLLPPGFAAFQNCFCAEYLFIGHSLKRQSEEIRQEEKVKEPKHLSSVSFSQQIADCMTSSERGAIQSVLTNWSTGNISNRKMDIIIIKFIFAVLLHSRLTLDIHYVISNGSRPLFNVKCNKMRAV